MNDRPLRLLHFSTGDTNGGAAQAAFRLHRSLSAAGCHSRMIVRQKYSDSDDVTEIPAYLNPWRARVRRLTRRFPPTPPPAFNLDVEPDIRTDLFYCDAPSEIDLVVLHSISRLLTVREIRGLHEHYRCPLVWALADQAPLTGGCHYSYDCDGYTAECGRCPQLGSDDPDDRSRTVLRRRHELLRDLPLTFIAPSSPAARWVRESSAFAGHRVEVIPAITDTSVFRPFDGAVARDLLHVPSDAVVVLVGAGDMMHFRKGLATYAPDALGLLPDEVRRRLFVLAVGARGDELLALLPVPGRALGSLTDEVALALAFQAADVFLCPTIADAGPLMIPESLLCGTPVVAFEVGYAVDLVRTGETGYVVRTRDAAELARGLAEVLGRERAAWRDACRAAALHHSPEHVVAAHTALYRELID